MAITTRAVGLAWPRLPLAALMAIGLLGSTVSSSGEEGSQGITKRTVFPAFDPTHPPARAPPGLAKVLAFVQENDREFLQGVDHGLSMAAKDRGLEYRRVLAHNDAEKMVEQIQAFRIAEGRRPRGHVIRSRLVRHGLQQVIWSGGFVGTIVPPPATLLLNAPQYATGKALTDAAIDLHQHQTWRQGQRGAVDPGHDAVPGAALRGHAGRARKLPGVTIVADISPQTVNKEGGFATMNTILHGQSRTSMSCWGRHRRARRPAALRAAGKARPDQFLGGIDGEPEAVAEIKKGNGPYKASIASPRRSSAMPWGSMAPTGSRARASRRRWISCPTALTRQQHRAIRGRPRRSGRGLRRPGAPRRLSQDVWQHLLRHPRPVRELSLVLGDQIRSNALRATLAFSFWADRRVRRGRPI